MSSVNVSPRKNVKTFTKERKKDRRFSTLSSKRSVPDRKEHGTSDKADINAVVPLAEVKDNAQVEKLKQNTFYESNLCIDKGDDVSETMQKIEDDDILICDANVHRVSNSSDSIEKNKDIAHNFSGTVQTVEHTNRGSLLNIVVNSADDKHSAESETNNISKLNKVVDKNCTEDLHNNISSNMLDSIEKKELTKVKCNIKEKQPLVNGTDVNIVQHETHDIILLDDDNEEIEHNKTEVQNSKNGENKDKVVRHEVTASNCNKHPVSDDIIEDATSTKSSKHNCTVTSDDPQQNKSIEAEIAVKDLKESNNILKFEANSKEEDISVIKQNTDISVSKNDVSNDPTKKMSEERSSESQPSNVSDTTSGSSTSLRNSTSVNNTTNSDTGSYGSSASDCTNIKQNLESKNDSSQKNNDSQIESAEKVKDSRKETSPINDNSVKGTNTDADKTVTGNVQKRKRRTSRAVKAAQEAALLLATEENKQGNQNGRQRRKTAKNAEEIIRKKFLNQDSDVEFSDGSEKLVVVNHSKISQEAQPQSPPSLKRHCPETDVIIVNGGTKKIKTDLETQDNKRNIRKLNFISKFFRRDLKEKLPRLTQEELEELLIQKIVETITMRSEIGKLREQVRISEKNQEATRARCQQLAKQIKDFEMVLSRNAADRRANNDKPAVPIKINRSVGLQVNFITEHGMQNLRQLQQQNLNKPVAPTSTPPSDLNSNRSSPRRGLKVRPPRRSDAPIVSQPAAVTQSQVPTLVSTITPAALVVAKPLAAQHTLSLPSQPNNTQQIITTASPQPQPQTIVLNGKIPHQTSRQGTTLNVSKTKPNDLIDLTDEEEKTKSVNMPIVTVTATDQPVNIAPKSQPCYQRVIQAIPGSVAITSQPTSIRVVQPAGQPTPTALVNNMTAPRLAYVMQSNVGPTRQLLIAPNNTTIRPVTSSSRASFSTLTYKAGISTVANGSVRVLTTPAVANVQLNKHPAPLPDTPNYAPNPVWKLPPPAPSLKISKVADGIILSWNMDLSEKYADIASYQLYAYQELVGVPPSTALWKKVGDVRALPLPMACTLTQFSEGNNYYFAVRAVDTHSRKGQYSIPGNISL